MNSVLRLAVRIAQEADLRDWQYFVDQTPGSSCMHHFGWHAVLREAYWVKPYYLIAEQGEGRIVGVLPLYHSRSPLTGSHLSSLEDGVLAVDEGAIASLLMHARSLRDEIGAKYLQVRGGPVDKTGSNSFPTVHTFIDTARPGDALWSAVKKKTRWAVRQAEKSGVRVTCDEGLAELEAFYRVYAEHMRALGTPVMGVDAFRAVRTHLGRPRLRLYLVHEGRQLIGGMLCILNERRWTDYLAIVRPSGKTEFANYLLYWHVIRDAAACGAPLFDLGRSTPDSNVHLFKRKWGGRDVEAAYQFYPTAGFGPIRPGLEQLKRGRALPQRLWSHLPLAVCNGLGPLLRKQLPFI